MCQFDYWFFECCYHRVIDIAQFCRPKLWEAGRNRAIKPCLETKYKTSQFRPGSDSWHGKSGTCYYCIEQHARNNLQRLSPGEPTGKRVAMCTIATNSQSSPGQPKKDSMSPYPSEVPIVFRRRLATTLPVLFGFRNQLDDRTAALFGNIVFPGEFMVYTPQTKDTSWTGRALGTRPAGEWYFMANGGLLLEDRKLIEMRKAWKDLKEIWRNLHHLGTQEELQFGSPSGNLDKLTLGGPSPVPIFSSEGSAHTSNAFFPSFGNDGSTFAQASSTMGMGQSNVFDAANISGITGYSNRSNTPLVDPNQYQVPPTVNSSPAGEKGGVSQGASTPQAILDLLTHIDRNSAQPQMVTHQAVHEPKIPAPGELNNSNQDGTAVSDQKQLHDISRSFARSGWDPITDEVYGTGISASVVLNGLNLGGLNFGNQGQLPAISESVSSSPQILMPQEVYGTSISASGEYNGLNEAGMNDGDQGEPSATTGSASSPLQMSTPQAVYGQDVPTSGVLNNLNQDETNNGDKEQPPAIGGRVPLQIPTPQAIHGPIISTSRVVQRLIHHTHEVENCELLAAISRSDYSLPQMPTPEAYSDPSVIPEGELNGSHKGAVDVEDQGMPPASKGQLSPVAPNPGEIENGIAAQISAIDQDGANTGSQDVFSNNFGGVSGQFPQYTPHPGGMEELLAAPLSAVDQNGTVTGNQNVFSNNGGGAHSQFPQNNTYPAQLNNNQAGQFNSLGQNILLANNSNQQNSSNLDEDPFGFDQGLDLSSGFGGQENSLGEQIDGTPQVGSAFQQNTQQTLAGEFGTPNGPGQAPNMPSYPQDHNLGSNDLGQSIFPPLDHTLPAELLEGLEQDLAAARRKHDIPGNNRMDNENYQTDQEIEKGNDHTLPPGSGTVDPRVIMNNNSAG
ncbi:hypothetical protein IFR05_009506 [Cadophora sp. M221]|nr:hypothetical protein IFR05_009506 [Cadophora sp. M221]